MWRAIAIVVVVVVVVVVSGCGVDTAEPTCASLGCPVAASGSPELHVWTPCDDAMCWCSDVRRPTAPPRACTRIPCATDAPLCAAGSHAEYGEYSVSIPGGEPVAGATCFCSPD